LTQAAPARLASYRSVINRSDSTPPSEVVEILREAIRQGDETWPVG
jgi:hypothetical protein